MVAEATVSRGEEESGVVGGPAAGAGRIALLGNPNTGKTTLFNRLCGLRHKTSNFPGTTQEARVGTARAAGGGELHIVDMPGIYSLGLKQSEAEICREVLAGEVSPAGERAGVPRALCIVADASNLSRNLSFVGEMMAQRLPMAVVLTMIDVAHRAGVKPDLAALEEALGCPVAACNARTGEGVDGVRGALARARVPNRTPPGDRAGLEQWADEVAANCCRYGAASVLPGERGPGRSGALTDRLDRAFTHSLFGPLLFALVMGALFYVLFAIAEVPMNLVDLVFGRLADVVHAVIPAGMIRDLLADGVVRGVGSTVIFLPQICLLFFLISLLEDTGYLARAAFLMDRLLRPFGLPGHAFVPLLSSHACALPGIMAARAIPDRRERLATILVAPFMTCSARIPVYVLVTGILFRDRPAMAALAFVGCYALGIAAGLFSAVVVRRTILRGAGRAMALELPTYKVPSVRTALLTTYDRAMMFLKNAGTSILAICIVLWWLGAFPRVEPPRAAAELRERIALAVSPTVHGERDGRMLTDEELRAEIARQSAIGERGATPGEAARASVLADGFRAALLPENERNRVIEGWHAEASRLEASHAKAESYIGRMGRFVQPVFEPLGYDWQLSIGVLTSFAAREVFVSTMAVVIAGDEDAESEGVVEAIREARRADGVTPVFTPATSWSLLVFYVLAMQCLPTLAVTAREAGGVKWALLQFAWMSAVAYGAAALVHRLASAVVG